MLLGGALGETRGIVDSGCERSRPGRDTTEGTQVVRTRFPKKQARSDGLYLAVPRLLLLPERGSAREAAPAIRVGLEPSSDVPRDEHRCQRTEVSG